MAAVAISNLKISIFGHVTVIGFNIWCSVPNFIKSWRFFTEIWRYNDFQNGGRPPSWILKIFSFCHVAFVGMPFCFRKQNFAEIGQSVDELWPKKRFSRWRLPPSWIPKISIFGHVTVTGFNILCSVPNFIKIGPFFTEIWRYNDFQNGGRQPSWILKICSFCHLALVEMPFCFLIQISLKSDNCLVSYGQKSDFKMAADAILNLKNFNFGNVTVIGLNICCNVPNFIKIG